MRIKFSSFVMMGLLFATSAMARMQAPSFYIDALYDDSISGRPEGYAFNVTPEFCHNSICGDSDPKYSGNTVSRKVQHGDGITDLLKLGEVSSGQTTPLTLEKEDSSGERHTAYLDIGGGYSEADLVPPWDLRSDPFRYTLKNASKQATYIGNTYNQKVKTWLGRDSKAETYIGWGNILDMGYTFKEIAIVYSLRLENPESWSPGTYSAVVNHVGQNVCWDSCVNDITVHLEVRKKLKIDASPRMVNLAVSSDKVKDSEEVVFTLLSKHQKINVQLQCDHPASFGDYCALTDDRTTAKLPVKVTFETSSGGAKKWLKPNDAPIDIHFPNTGGKLVSDIETEYRTIGGKPPTPGNYSGDLRYIFNASV